MRDHEMRYLTPDIREKIDAVIDQFLADKGAMSPDSLLEKITALLPIEKMHFDTVKARLEGFIHVTDKFWEMALASEKTSREEIVKLAKLRSLSHYHYLTGSREPANELLTRDDMFNDPTTALVKLHDDILGLGKVLPEILTESTTSA